MASGGIDEAKKRLLVLIGLADTTVHVYGDWREGMEKIYGPKTGAKLPIVTVRVSPAKVVPSFYGRIWKGTESGDVGFYSFTAHVFAWECKTAGEEHYKYAHDSADKIMTYLSSRDWNSSPHDTYPIGDVFDLSARESEPQKGESRRVCRVIIEGSMLVKRVD